MPSTSIDDCSIYYEIFGEGPPLVITGGGREGLVDSRPLAEKLGRKYRVILWDRAGVGRSDVCFDAACDLELWANQLSTLLYRLEAAPAYLVASSNGARASLVTALRYPDAVQALFLYLITGATERAAKNVSSLFVETADAARGGMEAVLTLPYWQGRISENAANRGRLLAMRPDDVERTMRRWAGAFDPTHTIMGLSDDDLRRIRAPARIIDATEPTDLMRRFNWELAERLPFAELVTDDAFQAEWSELAADYGLGSGHYTAAPSLERLIDNFVQDMERRA
jgi:pimeloyl-ACP methyl ester carboxylesterase